MREGFPRFSFYFHYPTLIWLVMLNFSPSYICFACDGNCWVDLSLSSSQFIRLLIYFFSPVQVRRGVIEWLGGGIWIPAVEKQRWVFGSLELWLAERIMSQIPLQTQKEGRLLCSKARLRMEVPECGLTSKWIICLFVFSVRGKVKVKAKTVQVYACAELGLRLIADEWGRRSCGTCWEVDLKHLKA